MRQDNNNKGHTVSETRKKIKPVKTRDYYNDSATDQAGQYKHGDDDATSSSYQRNNSLVLSNTPVPPLTSVPDNHS